MGAKALNGIGGGIEEEGGEPGGGGPPEGASATAAKRMVQAVQQFVAMLQIQQVGRLRCSIQVSCVTCAGSSTKVRCCESRRALSSRCHHFCSSCHPAASQCR